MRVELLAPGGSYESVLAAFNAGADAVYTGGELFGARAGAENLTEEQLIDVINYAHIHGKKLYLTINTLLKDKEIETQLFDYLKPLYEVGLDAVIVQDFGVMKFVKDNFLNLPIHASTQMTIFGEETAKALEEFGVQRIVVPREFSIKEIENIKRNTNIEIESFVHGALCYCYSGQCLMSSFIGGRSGNRGRCAQPCRKEYDLVLENKILNEKDEKCILSPKDICTLKILPQIIESGVYSLKIEGRMKKLTYIAGVVSIYRKYIDQYLKNPNDYNVSDEDINKLMDLFNRNGFSESYYYRQNGREMMSLKKVGFRKENREFLDFLREQYEGKKLKKHIKIYVQCLKNKPIKIETEIDTKTKIETNAKFETKIDTEIEKDNNTESEIKTVSVVGKLPQKALNKPITKETLIKQIGKLGNTDFVADEIEIQMDNDLFVPVGALNELRRKFVDTLYKELQSGYHRYFDKYKLEKEENCNQHKNTKIHCQVWNKKQFSFVLDSEIVNIISIECSEIKPEEIKNLVNKAHQYQKKLYIAMPYVFRQKDKAFFEQKYLKNIKSVDGVLIRNLEQYLFLKNRDVDLSYLFDYNVYMMNQNARKWIDDTSVKITAPVELNKYELGKLGVENSEMIVYGAIPVMTSAGCGLKTLGQCKKMNQSYMLKDDTNHYFYVKCVCDYCYNLMYNSSCLSLFQYSNEIMKLNPSSIRIIFTQEDEKQMKKILEMTEDTFINGKLIKDLEHTTRGHFTRGVL